MKHTKAIVNELQSLNIPVEQRNEYLCAALAAGLAVRLTLPTSKVKNIQAFFNENHRRTVVEFINGINEDIVFDAKEAVELVSRTYYLRYAFAFEPQSFDTVSHLTALMGCDRHVTPVKYKALLSNPSVAKTASDIQRTVMAVFQNHLNDKNENENTPVAL